MIKNSKTITRVTALNNLIKLHWLENVSLIKNNNIINKITYNNWTPIIINDKSKYT